MPSIDDAVLEPGAQGLQQSAPGRDERQVDVVDEVAARVAVAGQRALGQEVAALDRSGASGQPLAARWADSAARAEALAWARSAVTGPTTTGPSPKWSSSRSPP